MTDKIDWYDLASRQTFKTLPLFIEIVQKNFPGYEAIPTTEQFKTIEDYHEVAKTLYKNGIIAGILISYAAFHATSTRYGYSCNQAGVVRNCFYEAIMDTPIPLEQI